MKRNNFFQITIFITGLIIATNFFCQENRERTGMQKSEADIIRLPAPMFNSETSVEEALSKRRSVRDYTSEPLSLMEVSQLLWAAQGITEKTHSLKTAPSAGALYPLEVYLAAANVKDISAGLFKYDPGSHSLKKIVDGDKRQDISDASLRQDAIEECSAIIIITAVYERTSVKYGRRTERYVHMEVGHAGQNIYLQAVSLGIGTVMIGAFQDEALKKVLDLPANEFPLAIYPLGKI
ncbi:MAG: SagB/ThcOx family dehydrogenase [Ignavibacteriaceae bacterium]